MRRCAVPARSHFFDERELREILRNAGVLDKGGRLSSLPDGRRASLRRIGDGIDEALYAFAQALSREDVERKWLEASESPEERERRRQIARRRLANKQLKREREWKEKNEQRAKKGLPPLSRRGKPKRDERGRPEENLVGALAGVVVTELGFGFGPGKRRVAIDLGAWAWHFEGRLQLTTGGERKSGRLGGVNLRFVLAVREALVAKRDAGWPPEVRPFADTLRSRLERLTPNRIRLQLRRGTSAD
jgi:hypothetical protein